MTSLVGTLVLFTTLVAIPVRAASGEEQQDRALMLADTQAGAAVEPTTPPPAEPPPPPPAVRPAAPSEPTQPALQQGPADGGQWVHTEQYGWVWMPYGNDYTHVPPDDSSPSMYVYYPDAGWCWVLAPWLWGLGPMPYFGLLGPGYYGWYGYGLGRWYGFAGRYANWGWSGRAYWSGGHWNGVHRLSNGAGRGFQSGSGFRTGSGSRGVIGSRGVSGPRGVGRSHSAGSPQGGGASRSAGGTRSSGGSHGGESGRHR